MMMSKDNLRSIVRNAASSATDHNDAVSRPTIKPKVPTKFPSERHLGIYCERTGRIYNAAAARQNGTLSRLLKLVGQFFVSSARVTYCAELDKQYQRAKKLDDVDIMLLRLIRDGYRCDTGRYGRKVITSGEPGLAARYPSIFANIT